MRQRIFAKQTAKRLSTLATTFVFMVSVMFAALPSILNQVAHALPVSSPTTSSGFNSLGWTKDRTEPYSYSKTASELRFEINNTVTSAPSSATFYKWEGFQSNTALPANTDTVRASLYIDPAWGNKPVSVSMWGTTTNGTDNAWPIIDFSNGYSGSYDYAPGNFVGFRVYDTNTGLWHEVVPGASYFGTTVDLEIAVNQLTGKYEFYLNGNEIYSYDTQGYNTLTNVTFNNLNLKTDNALDNYVVRWTNFYTGALMPSAPVNGHFVHSGSDLASGSTVSYTNVRLEWDTYSVPARYRVTAHNPDGTTTNFQPSTTSSWNPPSMGWNINDQVRQGYFGAKGEGTYTYTLAVMNDGVWSDESAPLTLNYDISDPVVSYVTPSTDNQLLTSSNSIKVAYSDTVGLKQIVLHVYKQDGTTPVVSLWQNPYVSGTAQTLELSLTGIADGTYQIRAAAIDNAGHTTYANRIFRVDNTGPVITVQPGYLGNIATNTYREVGFNFYDSNKVAYVTLNGRMIDLTDAVYTNIDKVVQHSGWFGTHEGSNMLIAYDLAGNQTTLNFTIDSQVPKVTISPDNLSVPMDAGMVTVTGTVDDPSIKTVDVFVDNVAVGTASVANGKWTFDLSTVNYLVGVDYHISATATDDAGNTGTGAASLVVTSPVALPQIASLPSTPTSTAPTQSQPTQQLVFTGPQSTNAVPTDQAVEGAQTQSGDNQNGNKDQAVEGASDSKGPWSLWGVAWYWWLIILAVLGAIVWWLIAGYRRRSDEEA